MAGCSVSVNVIVPKRRSTSSHPQTEPGTVTVRIPPGGMPDPGPQFGGVPGVTRRVHAREGLAARRLSARIERIQLLLCGDVDDGEEIASRPDVHRLDDAEHGSRRNGGVDRVAAAPQHVDARLDRERLAARDHAVARHHLRAALRQPALGAIAGNGAAPGWLRFRVA